MLKVRGSLADRVAGLGHVSTVFDLLKRSAKHDPRGLGVAKMSCVRVVHQIAESSACAEEISSVKDAVKVLMGATQPMHAQTAFVVEAIKKLLQHELPSIAKQAMRNDVIPFLMNILDDSSSTRCAQFRVLPPAPPAPSFRFTYLLRLLRPCALRARATTPFLAGGSLFPLSLPPLAPVASRTSRARASTPWRRSSSWSALRMASARAPPPS